MYVGLEGPVVPSEKVCGSLGKHSHNLILPSFRMRIAKGFWFLALGVWSLDFAVSRCFAVRPSPPGPECAPPSAVTTQSFSFEPFVELLLEGRLRLL